MKSTFILPVLLLVVFSCKQEAGNSMDIDEDQDNFSSPEFDVKPLYIYGETDDTMAFEFLNIIDYSNFNDGKPQAQKTKNNDSTFVITLDSIRNPKIMEIMMFGNKFYNTRVFMTPGDSVKLGIKNKKISFNGSNADHYNFYPELDSLNKKFSAVAFRGNLESYKKEINEIYNKRVEFFNDYIKTHEVSQQFINHVNAELKYEYIFNLVAPRTINSNLPNIYINNTEGLIYAFENQSKYSESNFLDMDNYFDGIKIEDFNRIDLINNDYFKRSLTLLIRYYFTQQDYVGFNEENFDAELDFINNNLEGQIAKYTKAKVFVDYFEKGFGQDKTTHTRFKTEIENYLKLKSDPSYKAAVKEIEEELKVLNFNIPNTILQKNLLTIKGDTIRFDDLLQRKESTKFIAFWINKHKPYNYCERCVDDLSKIKGLQTQITNKNIEWIFISIAKTEQWHQDLILFENYLKEMSNYKILGNNMDSEILKYFKVNRKNLNKENYIELPRYIILDESNKVLFNAAPKIFDAKKFKNLLKK
jgi:hypothetical protein